MFVQLLCTVIIGEFLTALPLVQCSRY